MVFHKKTISWIVKFAQLSMPLVSSNSIIDFACLSRLPPLQCSTGTWSSYTRKPGVSWCYYKDRLERGPGDDRSHPCAVPDPLLDNTIYSLCIRVEQTRQNKWWQHQLLPYTRTSWLKRIPFGPALLCNLASLYGDPHTSFLLYPK